MVDYVYLGLYRFFSVLLHAISRRRARKLAYGLAWLAYHISRRRRNIINENLDLAYKNGLSEVEKKKIGIAAFMNLIETTFELMYRESMDKNDILKHIVFENEEIVQKYQREGKKLIFISGHYSNWELMAPAIAQKFHTTFVVVGRKLDSDVMDGVLKRSREKFDVELVYKKGAMKGCIKALNQDKSVGILVDQSTKKHQSIDVEFFGHRATHTPMASILSRKYEVDLIPIFIHTEGIGEYRITIYDPIACIKSDNAEEDLKQLTQAQADIMESVIKKDPKQWFWMHRRWK